MTGYHTHSKPAQSVCQLCGRLFCYFQRTKRRTHCSPCVEIKQRSAMVFNNDMQRRERLAARETAMRIHAEWIRAEAAI